MVIGTGKDLGVASGSRVSPWVCSMVSGETGWLAAGSVDVGWIVSAGNDGSSAGLGVASLVSPVDSSVVMAAESVDIGWAVSARSDGSSAGLGVASLVSPVGSSVVMAGGMSGLWWRSSCSWAGSGLSKLIFGWSAFRDWSGIPFRMLQSLVLTSLALVISSVTPI